VARPATCGAPKSAGRTAGMTLRAFQLCGGAGTNPTVRIRQAIPAQAAASALVVFLCRFVFGLLSV
jgi:hypothetical protein